MTGEKIYEYEIDVTGVTDYGIPLDAILPGQVPVPPQGVRVDVAVAGPVAGRLAGTVRGVDMPRATEPVADFFENVTLSTAAEEYAWVNARQGWAVGTVDLPLARFTSMATCSDVRASPRRNVGSYT